MPFYSPINYDRRKIAKRIYEMLAMRGYVDIKKMQGDTYVTTTEKGDEVCNQLLRELITFARLSNIAPTLIEADLSYEVYKIKKGASSNFLRENANLRMAAEKLVEDILEINSHFKEEMKVIEEEP
jgi:secreted Zn-dependent insulinase-like peptidase